MAAGSKEEDGEFRDSIDRISMLPDDILGCILSVLSFKEATATSILSRQWRYSWTFTRKLDFNGGKALYRLLNIVKWRDNWKLELDRERINYMRWVNDVIALCDDSSIEDFKVHFNLDKTHETCIDEWVRYAVSRNVETLELNLTTTGGGGSRRYDECYTFPYNLLGQFELKKLRRICMNHVNVSGEAMEFFLQNCPLLEELSVSESGHLLGLKITGPFPSFKRLEIELCRHIKSVEIRDVDLVYLKYIGERIDFVVANAPQLVNMHIGGWLTRHMEDVLSMFSTYLPQLEVFTLNKVGGFTWGETQLFYSAVKMKNLKQLMVAIFVASDESLLPLTNLLRASPCLHSFALRASRCSPRFVSVETKLEKISGSYPHLKEVKFLNYCSAKCDLELIVHLLENGKALEDIIVDTRIALEWDTSSTSSSIWNGHVSNVEKKQRARAQKQLQQVASPPGINLKILD